MRVMGTRGESGGAPWMVIAVGVGLAGLVAWFHPGRLSSLGCLAALLAPLGLFGGVALLIQRARERRERAFGSELREAVRADTAVLHRVSVAIPSRGRESIPSFDGGEAHAHRMLDAIGAHLVHATPYAHVVERLDDESSPPDEVARVAAELEARVYGAASEVGYRDEARGRRARAGEDGVVVVSVLVAARPTAQKWRPVRGTRDAKGLPDAILPIDPTHILATALVVTPTSEGTSFDASALRDAFPELTPLDATAARAPHPESESERGAEQEPGLLSAMPPGLPAPVAAFELAPGTVDETIAATLRRLEGHFGLPLPMNSPLSDVLRTAAAELESPRAEHTRERLLTALELSVNTALRAAQHDERLTRLVGSGGVIFGDARFLAIDDETRDALRQRTDVLFAPRPFESLREVVPVFATLAVFGALAVSWLVPGSVPPGYLWAIATTPLLSSWWMRRRSRGLALGVTWEAKYAKKPRPPREPAARQ